MNQLPNSNKLLKAVALRIRFQRLVRVWQWTFLGLCGTYAMTLLVSRLTGYWTGQFLGLHLPILALIALLFSLVAHSRPNLVDAARRIDQHGKTNDLFLTLSMLTNSAGEFQPLVMRSAEQVANRFTARDVVQFPWQNPVLQTLVPALVLWFGIVLIPQLDPFGKVAQAKEAEQRSEKLAQSRRATKQRIEDLQQAEEKGEKNSAVHKALEDLKNTFSKLEKTRPQENRDLLGTEQKSLGSLWRKLSAEKLAETLQKSGQDQSFGESGKETLEKWAKELQQGNAESLRKELREMKELAEKLAKSKDPAERAQLQQELKKKLQQMKELAVEKLQNKGLKTALDRALEQLESSKQEKLEKEGQQALQESMELIQRELKQVEMSAAEMQALEEALKTLQMAKKLNEDGKLETEGDEEFSSIEDYKELYEELMEEMGMSGEGEGDTPGDGRGEGGGEPEAEDDSVKTKFKTEQSKSAVKAGKILMSINTKGLPPSDAEREEVKTQYRSLIKNVKEGMEEAILQEQIPPGYHEGIKQYFNTLEEESPALARPNQNK